MARVTVEDCLVHVPNRFALVIVAARRTRQLLKGAEPRVRSKNRHAVTALREISRRTIYVEQDINDMLVEYIEASSFSRPRF